MQHLSEEQRIIVDAWTENGGAMLVSASAGSGKTRVLTESVRSLLENAPKERFRILCLTFTNRAAEEMQERLKSVKGIKERAFINTIHAFGLNVLKAYRHELGYIDIPHIIEKEIDRKDVLKNVFLQSPILEPYFMQNPAGSPSNLENHQKKILRNSLEWISKQKKQLVFIDDEVSSYNGWQYKHLHLYKIYNQYLRNQNLIEFDDILLLAWLLFSKPSVVSIYRRLYRYVLVDEAQDLNFSQYQVIKTLCADVIRNVLMVGDGNQAIHGYAGADKKYMFSAFVQDFGAKQRSINSNYRSSRAVLEFANTIIHSDVQNPQIQYFEGIAEVHSFADENNEAMWIIEKIEHLLDMKSPEFEGSVMLNKIAILARTRFVFNKLIEQLDANNFLYTLKKGPEGLTAESTLMKIFDLGTRIVANPQGEVYSQQLITILNCHSSPAIYGGLEFLDNLKSKIKSKEINSLSYDILLQSWSLIDKNISNFLSALDLIENKLSDIENENERSNAQNDITEWRTAWSKYIRNTPANSKSLADFRRYTAMGFSKLSMTNDQLTLATVHTSKGLEFDIVFLIGMTEGTFPDYRAKTEHALEEEKNNAYVAITRARRHIYISYPRKKMMPWKAENKQVKSSFLKELSIFDHD
ncbi:ATP-dependent helicase [Desulfobacterales bacterium HSG16]|nr:ATP-dependent helicase [Desulfobacterales bacterium HSG16]